VVRSIASLVHYPRLLPFDGCEEECTKHTIRVLGWVIAGENVSSTGALTGLHGGMHPVNLLRGCTRRRHNFGLQVDVSTPPIYHPGIWDKYQIDKGLVQKKLTVAATQARHFMVVCPSMLTHSVRVRNEQ
jgi:hypothetical protein